MTTPHPTHRATSAVRPTSAVALTMLLCLAACGCTVTRQVDVHVRSAATSSAVAGAVVRAEALNMTNPSGGGFVNPLRAGSSEAITDDAGIARFDGKVSFPAVFFVIAEGHRPLRIRLDRAPARPTPWLGESLTNGTHNIADEPPIGASLEVRIAPPADR